MSNDSRPDRRTTLRITACALGGGIASAAGLPILGLLAAPARRITVTSPTTPLDLGPADVVPASGEPVSMPVIAPEVRDGWNAVQNVALGSAWVSRSKSGELRALSSVCPHLSCTIGWDANKGHYLCPCHDSSFSPEGERMSGPSERGLDPLPITIKDGRIHLTWVRYRAGGRTREPV
jgi:Rieske Fe-S protein